MLSLQFHSYFGSCVQITFLPSKVKDQFQESSIFLSSSKSSHSPFCPNFVLSLFFEDFYSYFQLGFLHLFFVRVCYCCQQGFLGCFFLQGLLLLLLLLLLLVFLDNFRLRFFTVGVFLPLFFVGNFWFYFLGFQLEFFLLLFLLEFFCS